MSISATSEWLIGQVMHDDQLELTLYTAPTAALTEPATCPWTKIANSIGNGDKVQLWQCWGGDNQLWGFYQNAVGTWTIYLLAGNNLVLDANASCVSTNGCNVQTWTAWGGGNQHWFGQFT